MAAASVRDEDARQKVTGAVPFVLNLTLPGLAHVRCVRSPLPHARIRRVDASRALAQPGVLAVLTRDDLADPALFPYYGPAIKDQPIVAIEKARYVGDVVAAVLAETLDDATAAAALVDVEYDELPAVFDAVAALQPDAPLVHEQIVGRYELPGAAIIRPQNGTNLIHHAKVRRGDPERAFAAADLIHEETYRSPALQHCPLEPHVAVARWQGDQLEVWSATQTPTAVGQQLAAVFRLPPERVRVHAGALGSGYGSKSGCRIEALVAALARKAGRPARLALTRAEEFVTTTKHEARVRIKSGVRRDGTLLAREVEIHYNAGAYADGSGTIARAGANAAIGPYRIPNVKVDGYAVYTNRPNAVAFRGLAISQVAWAYERHTDELARRLGMGPLEFRKKNLLVDGDRFATGEEMHDVHFHTLLADVARAIGCDAPLPAPSAPERAVGRGVAVILKHMTSSSITARLDLQLDADGTVTVLCSTVELGQGARGVLVRETARLLGLPETAIRVPYPDTALTPPDAGTNSSRSSFFNGVAARRAADDLQRQLRELAARVHEVPAAAVRVAGGRVHVPGGPPDGLAVAALLRGAGVARLVGRGEFQSVIGTDLETGQGRGAYHWHQGAAGAVVEVDRETGKVYLVRLHLATYAGRVIDRANAELQNEGCAAFGLSQALFEEMLFDGGQVTNPNLSDYMIPSLQDFPVAFTTTLAESAAPDPEVHGLGETGLPAVPPAIGNAVAAAIGAPVRRIPLVPERILAALRSSAPAPAPPA
ncbi:MAG TPA: xanthine dehydrogenase family protein molybdopterin-binding subunit [Chloroflexota bacterium]|nr:xanthine dehydrogenase family protein molybdopterin-binding subunit [Chloroflexota bacterium]